MTIASDDIRQLIRLDTGEIDRRIFVDEEIFELEMREIFGRAWLFLCHETQIPPKPGDFFEATMGRDNVLVVRQRDRSIKAFLNTCTHRGNAVCRAEEGNTRNFMCTYHAGPSIWRATSSVSQEWRPTTEIGWTSRSMA